MCLYMTASLVKHKLLRLYLIGALFLNFCTELLQKLIKSDHTMVRLRPVEYEQGGDDVKDFEKVGSYETRRRSS